jgi:hypothetical protein
MAYVAIEETWSALFVGVGIWMVFMPLWTTSHLLRYTLFRIKLFSVPVYPLTFINIVLTVVLQTTKLGRYLLAGVLGMNSAAGCAMRHVSFLVGAKTQSQTLKI